MSNEILDYMQVIYIHTKILNNAIVSEAICEMGRHNMLLNESLLNCRDHFPKFKSWGVVLHP